MSSLPSWPDDRGQVIARGSFSPGHSRYVVIDPVRLQIAVSMSSRRSSLRNRVACSIPNHACACQAPPILPHARLQNRRKHCPPSLFPSLPPVSPLNLKVPLALQNP